MAKSKRGQGKRGKRGGKRRSKVKATSPMGLAAKLRGAMAEMLIEPKILTLTHQTTKLAATALAAVKGDRDDQKLVRATGKIMLAQNKMGKR